MQIITPILLDKLLHIKWFPVSLKAVCSHRLFSMAHLLYTYLTSLRDFTLNACTRVILLSLYQYLYRYILGTFTYMRPRSLKG